MMKLLKNREVRIVLLCQLALAAVACTVCFLLHVYAGLTVLALWVGMLLIYYLSTYRRYARLAALAEDINKLLHGDNTICFENYAEGELGILHSEIYKMTVRLREQQQKLLNDKAYLADSLADISHQIRTPLTSINLLVQLLSDPELSAQRRQQLTHELYGMLSRIDWLITTLLKISRLDAKTVQFKEEAVSLHVLLSRACEPLLVPMELRGQTLAIYAEGNITCDIAWTCEAIGNIVKNCMEHTPEGGQIRIDAQENALYIQIQIQDQGDGIAQEDLPHIFERFYKGKNADHKSFGVGLALARMIITGQNGTVKAENQKNGGALFTVRFYKGTL